MARPENRNRPLRAALSVFTRTVLTLLAAGLAATLLVGYAPGFGVDEKALDPRFSASSARLTRQSVRERGAVAVFVEYLQHAAQGDLGTSETFSAPVAGLIRERARVTIRNLALGMAAGWLLTVLLCAASAWARAVPARLLGSAATAVLLCVPAGLIAFGAVAMHLPAGIGIASVVFPRVFRYVDGMLRSAESKTHILAARARGLGETRILFNYALRDHAPQLFALAGMTANIALGAAVPMEVLCDEPGVGQLAWRAALGRDLDLVVAITLVLATATLLANRLAGLAAARFTERYA